MARANSGSSLEPTSSGVDSANLGHLD
jgi:hypothetical protein